MSFPCGNGKILGVELPLRGRDSESNFLSTRSNCLMQTYQTWYDSSTWEGYFGRRPHPYPSSGAYQGVMGPAAKRGLLYCVAAATCSSAGSWTGETNTVYRRRKRFSRSRRTHSVCGGWNAHAADSRCRSMTQMRTDNAHRIRRRYSQVWVAEPPAAVRPHGRHLSGCCRCPRNRPVIRDTPMLAIRGRAGGLAALWKENENWWKRTKNWPPSFD